MPVTWTDEDAAYVAAQVLELGVSFEDAKHALGGVRFPRHFRRDDCGVSEPPDKFHEWRMEAVFERYERRRWWRLVRAQKAIDGAMEGFVAAPVRAIQWAAAKLRGEG